MMATVTLNRYDVCQTRGLTTHSTGRAGTGLLSRERRGRPAG